MINPDQWRILMLIINAGGCLVSAIFVSKIIGGIWAAM